MKKLVLFLFAAMMVFHQNAFAQEAKKTVLFNYKDKFTEFEITADKPSAAMLAVRQYILKTHNADPKYYTSKEYRAALKERNGEKYVESKSIHYSSVWASDNHLSLVGTVFEFSGGAHGSTSYDCAVFDLIAKKRVGLNEILNNLDKDKPFAKSLFLKIKNEITIQKIVNESENKLTAAKVTPAMIAKHQKDDAILNEAAFDDALVFGNYALLSNPSISAQGIDYKLSRTPATHIAFFYSPYVFGAYAEGSFEVTLPLSFFKDQIKPEWRKHFAF